MTQFLIDTAYGSLFDFTMVWMMIITGVIVWGVIFFFVLTWLWSECIRKISWWTYNRTLGLVVIAFTPKKKLQDFYESVMRYPDRVNRFKKFKGEKLFAVILWIVCKKLNKPIPEFKYGLTIEKYNQIISNLKADAKRVYLEWEFNYAILNNIAKENNIKHPFKDGELGPYY